MSEWQPIETAPKDGTAVLVYDGKITTAEWYGLGGYWSLCRVGAWAEDSETDPTHWMPLPDPPSGT